MTTAATPLPPDRFFAAYVQAVNQVTGDRRQFMVLPPVDFQPGTPGFHHRGKTVWWERLQTLNAQRPRWSFHSETQESAARAINRYARNNLWLYAEPVVIGVQPVSVRQWIKERKTPYSLINLFQRVADRRGLVISGPTSKPQVVTPPPTS